MASYYNEHDSFAVAWLRELIKEGLIADGEVDERSIADVQPGDVSGFAQCHFFAGIGGWSLALRLAGWPDARPVWTGSCPCQPFSGAGAQAGGNDSRHLWPAWFRLIRECRPDVVFGEQVESAIRHGWLDLVCDDLEGEGYAVGAVGLPGACVGAFDIRARLWFVAESDGRDAEHRAVQRGGEHGLRAEDRRADGHTGDGERPETGGLADGHRRRRIEYAEQFREPAQDSAVGDSCGPHPGRRSGLGGLADGASGRLGIDRGASRNAGHADQRESAGELGDADQPRSQGRPERRHGPDQRTARSASLGSIWADAEWLPCRDRKARPVEPGTFPLAHGVPARVGRLRGYGNAIKPHVAAIVIEAYLAGEEG